MGDSESDDNNSIVSYKIKQVEYVIYLYAV